MPSSLLGQFVSKNPNLTNLTSRHEQDSDLHIFGSRGQKLVATQQATTPVMVYIDEVSAWKEYLGAGCACGCGVTPYLGAGCGRWVWALGVGVTIGYLGAWVLGGCGV